MAGKHEMAPGACEGSDDAAGGLRQDAEQRRVLLGVELDFWVAHRVPQVVEYEDLTRHSHVIEGARHEDPEKVAVRARRDPVGLQQLRAARHLGPLSC
jgi:hypothetical protein